MEKTLVLIKPDAYERGLSNIIIDMYKDKGLNIVETKVLTASTELATQHYAEHKDKPYFDELIEYITRSPLMAIVIEGDNAIERVRALNGSANPSNANEGTIRKLYGLSKTENSVHASDSLKSSNRELKLWFYC